ncbi:MAG: hypothetical protein JAY69_01425 [Candidatus Thiodiazotropha taylori]|nr:hypothetical protein [Candidatus Thiodiazotropha taylori]MCG7957710.1 hypothetical protein [Candidatus Thiodiazotropha taylori]MCG8087412.1 hypothetical protein [Candidatus Thiodiazotropha taylori]MCG8089321.1 hypothetical protein [Candidatus Thiodiazotropha taylori]MCW4231272.1 hypothetical protein [Candidatus Thiodiazotropha taylori]
MSGLARLATPFILMLALVACGGGDAETPWDSSGGTTGTGDTIDDAGTAGATIFLGNGSGSSFEIGELNIAVTTLSAGGQTSVRATLADVEGNLYQDDATVTFTTDCLASGLATIDSSVNTSDGVVTATYIAQGCSGSDTIRATTTVNGNTSTATGTVSIQPAEIGSMQFVSAEPSVIGIRGVGLTEVSKVSFQVLDTNGNPVSQQVVNFSLNTDIGGVAIPAGSIKSTSDIDGIVRTDVKSGTVPTTVRVTASLESNPLISTQSDGLVISTGVSDQNSISLSADTLNPEGLDIDGTEVDITVHASDHFNNPVPDGTAVYFTTEGGQIQSQCQTNDGSCTVVWTSSNPRPWDDLLPGGMGRISILATMLGEESFVDANGNGVLDAGDTPFADIPEAFRDDNEDGVRDPVTEEFVDFNNNNSYDDVGSDPNYNGALCCDAAAVADAQSAVSAGEDPGVCFGVTPVSIVSCSAEKNISVRDSLVLVMSESFPVILLDGVDVDVATGFLSIDLPAGISTYTFTIRGVVTGQVLPAGTTINFSTTNGTIETASSFIIPSTNANARLASQAGVVDYRVALVPTENRNPGDETGVLTVRVTTPSGATSTGYVIVND